MTTFFMLSFEQTLFIFFKIYGHAKALING